MSSNPHQDLASDMIDLQATLLAEERASDHDATVARRASRQLAFYEAIMETVPVGLLMADANGQIIFGNSHMEKIVRHPVLHSDNVDAYHEWVSFHEDGRRVESHEYPLARVINGEERSELDVHYQRGDGTRAWIRIIGEPVRNPSGERIGATVAVIDIDEERHLRKQQEILIAELNHRVKNAFSVVKSIVSQSLKKATVPQALRDTIEMRLNAYAAAHAKLVGTAWETSPLRELAADILRPIGGDRVVITGPDIILPSKQALSFSMAFYELATNATKYGALSVSEGRVNLSWELIDGEDGSVLEMKWIERGGPAAISPKSSGFGTFITRRAIQLETGGSVRALFKNEGYEWLLTMPFDGKAS